MAETLRGQTAVITGGASGIGLAVARLAHQHGAHVVIAGRRVAEGEAAATSVGAGARFIRTDVRDETDVAALMQDAGAVDLLFNNAGIEGPLATIDAYPAAAIDDVLATNVKGTFLCIKHALPRMQARGGVIVNTASFVGTVVPFPAGALYGATKAAVLSLTQTMAAATADARIRVYAVCPWITDTPMVDRLTGHQPEAKAQFGSLNPSRQVVHPEDVARIVVSMFAGTTQLPNGSAVLVDRGADATLVNYPATGGKVA
jgi:NAD(P)-dependent dehydrogenase (short-subunit alcohol dehydrogenase family)